MKEKIKIFFIFLFLTIPIFSDGIGDLNIKLVIEPQGTTKKYNVNKGILLDAGDINSADLEKTIEKKLAKVTVEMQTKSTSDEANKGGIIDYCVIGGGDFTGKYRIRDLRNINNAIETNGLKKYYGGNGIDIKLYQKNFNIINADVITSDGFNDTYAFSAYPDECIQTSTVEKTNIIKSLSYSFEIWIEIKNAKAGDIVRTDVTVGNTKANEEAIGAIKDLVREQFKELQK